MRVFVAGDTHGNTKFVSEYLYPTAAKVGASAILQVGDCGFWEQEAEGIEFMDQLGRLAHDYGIPWYWLHGNHDNWELAVELYGANRTVDGFMWIRPGVNYIPNGHVWSWAGKRMRAFGGAYSIDKEWRLKEERKRYREALNVEGYRRKAGRPPKEVPSTKETLWFSHEQMTDDEFAALMEADQSKMDLVFSHDKPRGANLGQMINLKDLPECMPNQDRLQRALLAHRPDFWIHGHFHHLYESMVRCGDDDAWTKVVGLAPDEAAAMRFWRPTHSWCLLDWTTDRPVTLTYGGQDLETPGE